MDKIKNLFSTNYLAEYALIVSLVCAGGFNEYISCAVSVLISVFLLIKIIAKRSFAFNFNLTSTSISVILLGYLISTFYATDSGMAFIGFLKFIPVLLYLLLVMQNKSKAEEIVAKLPYIALVLGLLSLVFMYIPFLSDYFNVADRLAGFFQYPNTFALFLLVGELTAISKSKLKSFDIIIAVILSVILLFTGSRAVLLIAILANFILLFFKKGKKIKIILSLVAALLVIAFVVLLPILRDVEPLLRLVSISFSESTFVGRILYFTDAAPVILKNPFGVGYMGYYYIQQSIQSGVYSVKYIHNDILQLAMDIGWIPCLLFLTAVIKSIFSKGKPFGRRVIIAVILLHSLFDFNLQFTAMFFVLLIFMDIDSGKEYIIQKANVAIVATTAAVGILSAYFAFALGASHFGAYEFSDGLYPANTDNKILLLISKDTIAEQNRIADDIISHNEYVQLAYSAKARYSYSQGDFEKLIKYKNKLLEIAPFAYDEYEEYCYMLIQGSYMYQQAGDGYSAEYCSKELIKTIDKVDRLTDRLSNLGKIIADQPKTQLPSDIIQYAKTLKFADK